MSTFIRWNRRILLSNIVTLLSGSSLAQGMTMIAIMLTARQLGATKYGEYVSAYTLASASAIFFNLGLDIWLLREGGRRPQKLDQVFGSAFTIKLVCGFIWLIALSGIAIVLPAGTFQKTLVQLSAFAVWMDSLFATSLTTFKTRLDNKINSILEVFSDSIWLFLTWILASYSVSTPEIYLGVRAAVLFFSLCVALIVVYKRINIRPKKNIIDNAIKNSKPYAASEFLAWAAMRQDILIVALVLGSQAVGLYSPAVGVVNALFMIPIAVYVVALPVLSNLFGNNQYQQAWKTTKSNFILLFAIGLCLWLGLWVSAPILIEFLGESFLGSLDILRSLSIILFIHSMILGMVSILVAVNQQKSRTIVQIIAVTLNAVLNVFAAIRFGLSGVVKVYILTEIIMFIGYSFLITKYYIRSQKTVSS